MSFRDLTLKPEYRLRIDNAIENFYNPVLRQSVVYKRAVVFFSSSALNSLAAGIAHLLDNGGKIQIRTSPRISIENIAAINEGFKRRTTFSTARKNLLSDLITSRRLEIKIALLEDKTEIGMFHEKLGLMCDGGGNVIAFSGSMNETANAFVTNYEAIDVFTSWTIDAARVKRKQYAFNAICAPGIKVLDFPEVNAEIPRDYRQEAVTNWAKNSYMGIFDMATGTGKTYTALATVTQLFNASKKILQLS